MAIPERVKQKIAEAKEKQLKELDLSNNYWNRELYELTKIPPQVFELTQLQYLDLGGNDIKEIPEAIAQLQNLKKLNLSSNRIREIPETIGQLSNLECLFLWGNRIKEIPKTIGQLSNLTQLNLSRNQIKEIPKTIGQLSNLKYLILQINKIKTIPKTIGQLSHLEFLFLSDNQLTEIPDTIGQLSNLIELDLSNPSDNSSLVDKAIVHLSKFLPLKTSETSKISGNQLKTLPSSISNLSNLKELKLDNNPLESPPLEIRKKGIYEIRKYLRQIEEEGEDYIYEAKLLIVGEGGAGKTTLANKIKNPKYKLQRGEKSTRGIDIIRWSFPYDTNNQFNVNIWDFGGQQIYHETHQFFLTKRSIYALVTNTRKEDTDFYYWLNTVELLSENSPLLIVKNEIEDRTKEINENALRGQFNNLKETLGTNLATNRNLPTVKDNLQHYLRQLPHIGTALPKTWVKVRQALESDQRNYIDKEEFFQICDQNGFKSEEDKLQLSGYLHDLGVCLHFQDEEDSLLYRTVILKPTWATDAVYKVLDNLQVINNRGVFTRQDLKTIWKEKKYRDKQGELLELMKKFQLCYEIPQRQNYFIVPQLLNENEPNYEWDDNKNLIMRYRYPSFMIKGIMTRFIVVMHRYIDTCNGDPKGKSSLQQCVWKSGVVLIKDKTKAEVIENYGKREITIRVVGEDAKGLLTIVSHEIDKINESYTRLNYKKLIPCNCEVCRDSQDPHLYNYHKLVEKYFNEKLNDECEKKPYHTVKIASLIDNAFGKNIEQLSSQQKNIDDGVKPPRATTIERVEHLTWVSGEQGRVTEKIVKNNIEQNHSGSGDNVAGNKTINNNQTQNTDKSVTNNVNSPSIQGGDNNNLSNDINTEKKNKLLESPVLIGLIFVVIVFLVNVIFNREFRQWLRLDPPPSEQQNSN